VVPNFVETRREHPRLASIGRLRTSGKCPRVKVISSRPPRRRPKLAQFSGVRGSSTHAPTDAGRGAELCDFSVIYAPKFGISASVLDKGPKEVEYASRRLLKRRNVVAGDPLYSWIKTHFGFLLGCSSIDVDRLMHYNDDWLAFTSGILCFRGRNGPLRNLTSS